MNKSATLLLSAALMGSPVALASDSELGEMKAQLKALLERVEQLEQENTALKATSEEILDKTEALAGTRASSWTDTIKLKGDFRYRYEQIDQENKDTRERNRVRARLEVSAQPSDNIKVGLGFASGSDDPVSTNQSLGGGSSTKDLRLDLAYMDWHASPSVHVIAGKMKNVFHKPGKNSLMWDGDWRPEGLSVTFKRDGWFANSSLMWLESDTKKADHRFGYGFQGGFSGKTDSLKYTIGTGYYQFGTEGRGTYVGDADEFFGNSYACTDAATLTGCAYTNDYSVVEVFADVSGNLGDLPASAFAHYVTNTDADDYDRAWAVGFKLGKAGSSGPWDIGYTYQDIERDSMLAVFTDSDFAGGGTDGKGHIVKANWSLNSKWSLGLTYFNTDRDENQGKEASYERIQIDTVVKF